MNRYTVDIEMESCLSPESSSLAKALIVQLGGAVVTSPEGRLSARFALVADGVMDAGAIAVAGLERLAGGRVTRIGVHASGHLDGGRVAPGTPSSLGMRDQGARVATYRPAGGGIGINGPLPFKDGRLSSKVVDPDSAAGVLRGTWVRDSFGDRPGSASYERLRIEPFDVAPV